MTIIETPLKGCYIIKPSIFKDSRGVFFESFNKKNFNTITSQDFVQDNQSISSKGVLRGLHFQKGKYAQAKLVSVTKGSVQDVIVDLRPKSPTYGNHFSIHLSDKCKTQVYIPRGMAHGFLALEDNTIFSYKCDNYYNKEAESGIIYNDQSLEIKWKSIGQSYTISDKDLNLPRFKNLKL